MERKKIFISLGLLSVLVVLAVIPVIIVYSTKPKDKTTSDDGSKKPFELDRLNADEKDRINCFLEEESRFEKLTEYQCKTVRGCLYKPSEYQRVPTCYFDREKLGYKLVSSNEANGIYELESNKVKAPYMGVIEKLKMNVNYYEGNIIQVKITDKEKERYEVPYGLNLPAQTTKDKASAEFQISSDQNGLTSSFKIVRKENNQVLFDTNKGAFVYSDQFLQISTKLLERSAIYGFGENNHESLQHDLNYRSWGMFARDNAPGWGDNRNNYGFQPVYFVMEPSGKCHLVLLYNSNAMEYLFTPSPSLTIRTIGGILDFYFIVDDTPEKVLQHYHKLIGLPMFPPYWSLGFQISRWGYDKLSDVRDVVDRTRNAKLLHDVQYIDIEYMIGYRILTIDQENFKGTYQYKKELEKNGTRLVLIVDPGLVMEPNNTFYTDGVKEDIYVKWPEYLTPYDIDSTGNNEMISWCWPNGKLSYPDYMNENTHNWWTNSIKRFINDPVNGSDMDGIWIDMNEPSSFETNEIKPWNWLYPEDDQDRYPYFTLKCPKNKYDDPPYRTKSAFAFDDEGLLAADKKARLSQKTLCMIGLHKLGGKTYLHYDVHNLYAHSQAIASFNSMELAKPGLRPFVLTRSNFVGTGKYSSHWLGDNDSTWKHMKMSIIGLIENTIFGMPMIGADICGFFIDVQDAEMCTRWLQLGAFYTFSRNHNANKNIAKDPVSFNDKTLLDSTRNTYKIRYTILPYIYTLFFKVHNNGGSVLRPLFFEFPTDNITFSVDQQFLIGSSFLVSPVLNPGQTSVNAYFPDDKWYDYRTGKLLEKNGWNTLKAPLDYINLHLRGGSILATQDPLECLNTQCSRNNPLGLIISLDKQNKASGELFWDNGVSNLNQNANSENFYHVTFNYENKNLKMTVAVRPTNTNDPLFGSSLFFKTITVNGFENEVNKISVNGKEHTDLEYKSSEKVLVINNLDGLELGKDFIIDF